MKSIYNKHPGIKGSVKDLVETPKYVLVQDFSESATRSFIKDFEEASNTGQEIIPIIIDSYGGEVYSLLAMVDIILRSPIPVATIALGKAMSCGAILLAYGTKGYRFAAPTSTIMLHEISKFSWGKLEDMKSDLAEMERLTKLIFHGLSKQCGHKDKNYFVNAIHERRNADWYLDPKQAHSYKLIDTVGIPEFRIDLNLSIKLVTSDK